jgi:hypothetical protein
MVEEKDKGKKRRTRRKGSYQCTCCGKDQPFCWTCPCGFQICNTCMEENLWGFTCSGVYWQCPDCGALRPF